MGKLRKPTRVAAILVKRSVEDAQADISLAQNIMATLKTVAETLPQRWILEILQAMELAEASY